ncbi:MAG TPA: hypothetical protein VI566_13205 [Xanthomonadales bacterium]|nr:hypothetical protein [Xanthomonadales bacterium]
MRTAILCVMFLLLIACSADSVSDRRVGQVVICHKDKKTITVSNAASFAHLDHGDTIGPCPVEK